MAKRPLQKMCLKCREVKPIEEFYRNNGWAAQNYADMICRECARKEVIDRDTARQYCWNNNRLWSDAIWEAANKKAPMTEYEKKLRAVERAQAALEALLAKQNA